MSVAMQDLPVLLGPTNTVKGRSSIFALLMGPKLVTPNVRRLLDSWLAICFDPLDYV